MMGIHFNYKIPKMGNDEHTMEMYTFPIMEIDSQSHQWVFRLGIDEFPFFFPSVGFRFFFLCVAIIDDGHGLTVEVRCINQPNKSKLSLYKLLLSFYYSF